MMKDAKFDDENIIEDIDPASEYEEAVVGDKDAKSRMPT